MENKEIMKDKPRKATIHTTRKLPVPEMVTCETPYGAAYCWKCEADGTTALGNTRLDAQVNFQKAYENEHDRPY